MILAKYLEWRRINAMLHKATKAISEVIAKESVKPVMENLKDIGERMEGSSTARLSGK